MPRTQAWWGDRARKARKEWWDCSVCPSSPFALLDAWVVPVGGTKQPKTKSKITSSRKNKIVFSNYFFSASSNANSQSRKKVILVFFLGGCTYSEITSLRFLGKQKGNNYGDIKMTTNRVKGSFRNLKQNTL